MSRKGLIRYKTKQQVNQSDTINVNTWIHVKDVSIFSDPNSYAVKYGKRYT